jgi:hypothetical protein
MSTEQGDVSRPSFKSRVLRNGAISSGRSIQKETHEKMCRPFSKYGQKATAAAFAPWSIVTCTIRSQKSLRTILKLETNVIAS